jgi:hypothetical protein
MQMQACSERHAGMQVSAQGKKKSQKFPPRERSNPERHASGLTALASPATLNM